LWWGMCDRLEKVEKCGNEAGTSTQNMSKVGAESKSNNNSRAERIRWADYEDFEDEAMGHRKGFRHPRNQRDFGNRTRGQFD